ncbi:hypothetical protein FXO38_29044 [Capsicum annuum]|uniref:Uncharacterized protein n=1 Tax=Capsicum annuum TaxID=4072 RepID=A0A2G2YJZ8_CAPAN|nr:hypothetical protein FXO37_30236 [Capsicum annuum]KAF3626815.1 hypothetical protein FXO38_29044 [Capsicum annuum]PHT70058.1 hypothetical protein T459_25162 [Capsicum annuum]
MSEIGKKARAFIKGGSLHTSGAQSQGKVTQYSLLYNITGLKNVNIQLILFAEKETWEANNVEAFKAIHKEEENPRDPDVWVEP